MTSKKRRQRGSRTHGGGTHKNRRGAGHRGGRGNAGRSKHEKHLHDPLGKHGFKRPQKTDVEVAEISVRELDENVALYASEDLAEVSDGTYHVDARDVVEDGHEVDAVKVLGTGQVRHTLVVTADDFSETAVERIEDAGGRAEVSERGPAVGAETDGAENATGTEDEA
ncbi:MAG: uL15m family ribosomal protein [Halobacteriaceae archaeon]